MVAQNGFQNFFFDKPMYHSISVDAEIMVQEKVQLIQFSIIKSNTKFQLPNLKQI